MSTTATTAENFNSTNAASSRPPAGPAAVPAAITPPARRGRRWWAWPLLALALVAGGWYGLGHLSYALAHESTDDAQIEGHINPVLPQIAGRVVDLLVEDNARVEAGQPLLHIEPRDYDIKIEAAQAALGQARADLASKQTLVVVVLANVAADAITLARARGDFARDEALFKGNTISEREYTDSKANAENAAAQHTALEKQVDAARAQIALSEATIAQRQADLDAARLQRSYTTLVAPTSGIVSRRSIEVGQYVQPGQSLLAITGDQQLWVVANFKETQLDKLRVGQPVALEVDAYPGVEFTGRVESFSGATGAKFALLPPDNATGNFVKVTQRVPVRIALDPVKDLAHPLRLGLSAVVNVAISDAAATPRQNPAVSR